MSMKLTIKVWQVLFSNPVSERSWGFVITSCIVVEVRGM